MTKHFNKVLAGEEPDLEYSKNWRLLLARKKLFEEAREKTLLEHNYP